jgi:hypothetical protein
VGYNQTGSQVPSAKLVGTSTRHHRHTRHVVEEAPRILAERGGRIEKAEMHRSKYRSDGATAFGGDSAPGAAAQNLARPSVVWSQPKFLAVV